MRKALLVLALLAFPLVSQAAPIVLGGSNTYTAWTMSSATFWNNTSYDRNGQANIGRWLTGTGGSDVPGFYDDSPYLNPDNLGGGSTQFGWNGSLDLTHVFSITGWNDSFGVYDLITGDLYYMGSAWDTTPSGASYFPAQWGFWLYSGEGYIWRSGELDSGRSHFALFNSGDTYWLGVEDATWTTNRTADWDYNDVILTWKEPSNVPEPVGLRTLALGLAAIAFLKRRWQ